VFGRKDEHKTSNVGRGNRLSKSKPKLGRQLNNPMKMHKLRHTSVVNIE